jgi:hypothetical protein
MQDGFKVTAFDALRRGMRTGYGFLCGPTRVRGIFPSMHDSIMQLVKVGLGSIIDDEVGPVFRWANTISGRAALLP